MQPLNRSANMVNDNDLLFLRGVVVGVEEDEDDEEEGEAEEEEEEETEFALFVSGK